jgi:hypothetical protein
VTIGVVDLMTGCKPAVRGSALRVLTIVMIVLVAACFWTVAAPDHKANDAQDQQQNLIDSNGEDAWLSSPTR